MIRGARSDAALPSLFFPDFDRPGSIGSTSGTVTRATDRPGGGPVRSRRRGGSLAIPGGPPPSAGGGNAARGPAFSERSGAAVLLRLQLAPRRRDVPRGHPDVRRPPPE